MLTGLSYVFLLFLPLSLLIINLLQYSSDDSSNFHSGQKRIGYFSRSGFETTAFLGLSHQTRYVAAVAVDKAGEALGATHILDMQTSQAAGVLNMSNFDLPILEDEMSSDAEDQDAPEEQKQDPSEDGQQPSTGEEQPDTDDHDATGSSHFAFGGGLVVLAGVVLSLFYWRCRRSRQLFRGKSSYKALDTEARV